MYQVDFHKPQFIHFIGIGGISMSGLAEVLLGAGFRISGSDAKASALTERLTQKGANVIIGQSADNISADMDCVVYTAAIHPDNPEFRAAKEAGIPMLTRAELLGEIMKQYRTAIAVAGTHGKTTTTSMASHILLQAEADPTISVGGMLPVIGGNIRVGASDVFLAEACEYTNSFLSLFPTIGIVLNIDADHLDFFKDLDDITHSFRKFAELIPEDGTLIINRDSDRWEEVAADLSCHVLTYGSDDACDYRAVDISHDENGCGIFTCLEKGTPIGTFRLSVPGAHNVSNALSVIAMGRILNIAPEVIAEGLAEFKGTERRFEYKGERGGITIIDDYAHHPTEIAATLSAAENYPHKELWLTFQPHTYTRTKSLLPEFAKALSKADHVVLPDIYAARETDTLGISSDTLREKIAELGTDAHYFPSFAETENFLMQNAKPGDLIITMGAGNVVEIGEDLLKQE